MPVFAANLTMMFTELPFPDRFSAAADQGFQWVEFLFPYDFAPEALARALERNGLRQALFNLPPGDWSAGERGLACLPGREKEFDAGLEKAVLYAEALNCPRLHVMAGNRPPTVPDDVSEQIYLNNIRRAAQRLADESLELCLEPINHYSMPGYFLRTQEQAAACIETLDPTCVCNLTFFTARWNRATSPGGCGVFSRLWGTASWRACLNGTSRIRASSTIPICSPCWTSWAIRAWWVASIFRRTTPQRACPGPAPTA